MTDAPERIHASLTPMKDGWYQCVNTRGGQKAFPHTEYVRADLSDAKDARIAELGLQVLAASTSSAYNLARAEAAEAAMTASLQRENDTHAKLAVALDQLKQVSDFDDMPSTAAMEQELIDRVRATIAQLKGTGQ